MYHDSSGIIFRYFSPQYRLHTAFTPELSDAFTGVQFCVRVVSSYFNSLSN